MGDQLDLDSSTFDDLKHVYVDQAIVDEHIEQARYEINAMMKKKSDDLPLWHKLDRNKLFSNRTNPLSSHQKSKYSQYSLLFHNKYVVSNATFIEAFDVICRTLSRLGI